MEKAEGMVFNNKETTTTNNNNKLFPLIWDRKSITRYSNFFDVDKFLYMKNHQQEDGITGDYLRSSDLTVYSWIKGSFSC